MIVFLFIRDNKINTVVINDKLSQTEINELYRKAYAIYKGKYSEINIATVLKKLNTDFDSAAKVTKMLHDNKVVKLSPSAKKYLNIK